MKTHLALLCALLSVTPLAASAADVWVASATEKIRPETQPRQTAEARIAAAKNEFEAFQVVVTGPATGVRASVSALTGPGKLEDVKLYRVDTINVSRPSALDGGTGRWPDALVPDVDDVVGEQRNAFPFDVNGGESRAIWVEVHVPSDAAAGTYYGTVSIASSAGQAQIPVQLEVWDFALPSTASLRSHFGMSYGILGRGHAGISGEADAKLRARYAQLGLDHRISLSGVADDGYHTSFDHFDRFYRPLVDGTAQTRLSGAKLTSVKYVGNRTSVEDHRRWAEKARAEGWFDELFDYTCDEPPLTCAWSEIAPRTQAAHDADPEFRTLVTTAVWDAEEHGVADDIDILAPVINYMDDKSGELAGSQRARYDGFLSQKGTKEVWMYQSCMSHGCGGTVNIGSPSDSDKYFVGWPTYMIDASAVRNRAMEWVSFIENVTGELYWESMFAYQHDAWSNQWDFSGNGDGTLFYPGTPSRIGGSTDIPVASIRLKMIREGMEDYEYLNLLAGEGHGDAAREVAKGLFPSASGAEVDPEALLAARAELAQRILVAQGKPVQSSPITLASAAGGCGSSGGFGAGAFLALPLLLLAAVLNRRVTVARVSVRKHE